MTMSFFESEELCMHHCIGIFVNKNVLFFLSEFSHLGDFVEFISYNINSFYSYLYGFFLFDLHSEPWSLE
jgi:hypothetical protein